MSTIGKNIRLKRLFRKNNNRCIIVPVDHGVTIGPVKGLSNIAETVASVAKGGADAILLHRGIFTACPAIREIDTAFIMHLSAATSFASGGNNKVLVTSVEEAVRLGVDAVSVHVTLGASEENMMLRDLGRVSEAAARWGMPLLAMIYARGEGISSYDAQVLGHAARVAAELGADIVKINYCGDVQQFREIVEGCPIPVVIAGGAKLDSDAQIMELAHDAVRSGSAGLSMGRNIFQHSHPDRIVRALSSIVHEGQDVAAALSLLTC